MLKWLTHYIIRLEKGTFLIKSLDLYCRMKKSAKKASRFFDSPVLHKFMTIRLEIPGKN